MTGYQDLLARLRVAKPDQPGWWMIERDDMETRPMYLSSRLSIEGDVSNWHQGPWWWQPEWSKALRFATENDANTHHGHWHFDRERELMHIRSHGMMTEYRNPDGPEAAEVIEALEAALASVGRNPTGEDRADGLRRNDEHANRRSRDAQHQVRSSRIMDNAIRPRPKRVLKIMHVSLGGSPEQFEQLWAAKLRREAADRIKDQSHGG